MKPIFRFFVLASLCPAAAVAQEAEPGGVFFTFDVNQSFETSSDRDLTTVEDEDGIESLTSFRFGAVTETRVERLSFEATTGIRVTDGEVTNDDVTGRLAYNRNSADALLETSVSSVRSDIAFLRDITDFINLEGELEVPDDFEDLTGTGLRLSTTVSAALRWGETKPIGYSVSLSQQFLRYEDASAELANADSISVDVGARLNINEVLTGNVDLSFAQTDEVGVAVDDSTSLSGALTLARPLGDITGRVTVARDEDDEIYWSASVERVYALPNSSLRGAIGIVEDASEDARLTAEIAYSLPRPTGQVDLSLFQRLSAGDDRATTVLSATYFHQVNPLRNLTFEFDFGQASDPDGSDAFATASLSASYGIQLTELWQLNVGARANLRDDDGDRTRSNSVFLAVDRPISWRP